ncbi:MAG: CotH kinase family protein [Lachnospiraceae bacterium]|nr:CotH kinase family protein [Lachnospiraceae bacterium]MDD7076839.1 CotH kinase family protein [Lachnospiraceae bacterium]
MQKRGNKWWYVCVVLLIIAVFFLNGVKDTFDSPLQENATDGDSTVQRVEIAEKQSVDETGMIEDTSVYDEDDPDSVVYFYVTVQKGDAGSDTDHTFAEVNSAVRFQEDTHVSNDIYARAIVQVGDENGPQPGKLGYGAEKSNARIRVRGNSSSVREQKSYKLDLDDTAGLWRGQSNIALNKSVFDVTRIKNKLYFDMLKDVDGVPSIRTQFVRLFIKDETSGQTAFEDYGLYTQAEVPGKKYLANHGLSKEGYLYKAISFNFEMSEGLKNFDDPDFDQEAFDQILSCKGRQDNEKLIELVEMINDRSIDINEIIGTYIDRENFITWLAYNILTANTDTTVQNFYLYSPVNSKKWFFIPWDGDNMLHAKEDEMEGLEQNYGDWEHGVSNYWGVILFQRFLKNESNRQELADKVDELYEIINRDNVNALVAQYNETVEPYVLSMPDIYYLNHTKEERDEILEGLGAEVDDAYQRFYDSLHELMPFFQYTLEQEKNTIRFSWSEAYDFDNEMITYRLRVSRTPDMADPVIDQDGLTMAEYETTTDILEPGTWYWAVTASTEDGRSSQAMDKILVNDVYYPGVLVSEVQE